MSFWTELRRRNVFRVAAAYAVVAWLLIEISDTIFPRLQLPEWSVTLVIALLIVGFPLALFFAWAFELTPEGLKREREVDRTQSIAPQTGRKLDFFIIGVLAVAVAFFAVDKFVLEPAREAEQQREQSERLAAAVAEAREAAASEKSDEAPPDHSIAVLAFDDMSPDGDQEYLSDGIAEELLNLLAQIPELRVISRSSSFFYKGKDVRLEQIAEELNVAHILEGSVRKAGDQVRITAQLIDARNDSHVWSESYDRTLEDIFAMQDEIAAEVVDQLEVTLLGDVPAVSETDPEAYDLYLQARHLGGMFTAEAFEESNALYRKALAIDPDYVDARAGLGLNFINQVLNGLQSRDGGFARAREALERALAIDPEHALAHSRLGLIATLFDNDLPGAARHHERALALAPADVDVLSNAAVLLIALGRHDQAVAVGEVIRDRDPLTPITHSNLAQVVCVEPSPGRGHRVVGNRAAVEPRLSRGSRQYRRGAAGQGRAQSRPRGVRAGTVRSAPVTGPRKSRIRPR